jgi:hypothetical protein
MKSNVVKKVAKRYVVLIAVIAVLFIYILLNSEISGMLFANILATLALLAIIPFAIIYMIKKQQKK